MQFNLTASKQGIVQDIDFLCGSTSATYPLADKTRNVNIAYHNVSRIIREEEHGWQYDDINKSDFPIATSTLVHGQHDYELPDGAQGIEMVSVKDSAGNYKKLTQIDWHDIDVDMNEYFETNAMPLYYDLVATSIFLYPAPSSASVTTVSGIKAYFSRDIVEFTTASTTVAPGFATPYHRILAYSAAIDFIENPEKIAKYVGMKTSLEKGLRRFYSSRNVQRKPRLKPQAKKYWRQYK